MTDLTINGLLSFILLIKHPRSAVTSGRMNIPHSRKINSFPRVYVENENSPSVEKVSRVILSVVARLSADTVRTKKERKNRRKELMKRDSQLRRSAKVYTLWGRPPRACVKLISHGVTYSSVHICDLLPVYVTTNDKYMCLCVWVWSLPRSCRPAFFFLFFSLRKKILQRFFHPSERLWNRGYIVSFSSFFLISTRFPGTPTSRRSPVTLRRNQNFDFDFVQMFCGDKANFRWEIVGKVKIDNLSYLDE